MLQLWFDFYKQYNLDLNKTTSVLFVAFGRLWQKVETTMQISSIWLIFKLQRVIIFKYRFC